MATYVITYDETGYEDMKEIRVEAGSEDEACEKAEKLIADGGMIIDVYEEEK